MRNTLLASLCIVFVCAVIIWAQAQENGVSFAPDYGMPDVTDEGEGGEPAADGAPRQAANIGSLSVSSTPDTGAEIYQDYFDTGGKTNATISQVQVGSHAVSVTHPSYPPQPPQEGIQVFQGVTTGVPFALIDQPNTGSLTVRSAPEYMGAIFLDYIDTGQLTDATISPVAAGTHFVSVRKDGTVPPGILAGRVNPGENTILESELYLQGATQECSITVYSFPPDADIYLDYIFTGLMTGTGATLSPVGHGTHDVVVRKSGYLIPPPQTVELSPSTCSTSVAFTLVQIPPTPFPTPTPLPTPIPPPPFPQGLQIWLNQENYTPGDVLKVVVTFTDTYMDWDGYLVITGNGGVWSILGGNRLQRGVHPIVWNALEWHLPFEATAFTMVVPYGVTGCYTFRVAILPTGWPPTLANAMGPYGQYNEANTCVK